MLSPQTTLNLDLAHSEERVVIGECAFHRGYSIDEISLARLSKETKLAGTEETLGAIWITTKLEPRSAETNDTGCFKISFDEATGSLNVWNNKAHLLEEENPYRFVDSFDKIKTGESLLLLIDGKQVSTGPVVGITVSAKQEYDPQLTADSTGSTTQALLDPVSSAYQRSASGESVIARELYFATGFLGESLRHGRGEETDLLIKFLPTLLLLGKEQISETEQEEAQTLLANARLERQASLGDRSALSALKNSFDRKVSAAFIADPDEQMRLLTVAAEALGRVSPKDALKFYDQLKEFASVSGLTRFSLHDVLLDYSYAALNAQYPELAQAKLLGARNHSNRIARHIQRELMLGLMVWGDSIAPMPDAPVESVKSLIEGQTNATVTRLTQILSMPDSGTAGSAQHLTSEKFAAARALAQIETLKAASHVAVVESFVWLEADTGASPTAPRHTSLAEVYTGMFSFGGPYWAPSLGMETPDYFSEDLSTLRASGPWASMPAIIENSTQHARRYLQSVRQRLENLSMAAEEDPLCKMLTEDSKLLLDILEINYEMHKKRNTV